MIETYAERIVVPGQGEADTTAVTYEIRSGDMSDRVTGHVINVDNHWRWMLKASIFEAMAREECP